APWLDATCGSNVAPGRRWLHRVPAAIEARLSRWAYVGPMQYSNGAITVAAVLTSSERQRIEIAAGGVFSLVHRDSVRDAATVVRERPVDAVLVSVHRCGREQVDAVRNLVRDFPGVPTLAL